MRRNLLRPLCTTECDDARETRLERLGCVGSATIDRRVSVTSEAQGKRQSWTIDFCNSREAAVRMPRSRRPNYVVRRSSTFQQSNTGWRASLSSSGTGGASYSPVLLPSSGTVQLLAGGPYCKTLTFSSVTRPLVIRPSKVGKKALIFSSLSTISMIRGRSSDSRKIFAVCSRLE